MPHPNGRKYPHLAALLLTAVLALSACSSADDPPDETGPSPSASPTPTESAATETVPATPAQPPLATAPIRKVSPRTLTLWAKELNRADKALAHLKKGVPTSHCTALNDDTAPSWFAISRGVIDEGSDAYALFGVNPNAKQAYSCDVSEAMVVVDLTTGEALAGESLFTRIERVARR
jgi:hypothetical protein